MDKEDDWESIENTYKHERLICIDLNKQEARQWRNKRVWRRENYFNDKAGGTYTKVNRLKTRREMQQYLYFHNEYD